MILEKLEKDLLYEITVYLTFDDILNFSIVNRFIYEIFDDDYYEYLANTIYSKIFWILAKKRPAKYSTPLFTYKQELLRIESFQSCTINNTGKRWCEKDFYNYWKYEQRIKKKNKLYSS